MKVATVNNGLKSIVLAALVAMGLSAPAQASFRDDASRVVVVTNPKLVAKCKRLGPAIISGTFTRDEDMFALQAETYRMKGNTVQMSSMASRTGTAFSCDPPLAPDLTLTRTPLPPAPAAAPAATSVPAKAE